MFRTPTRESSATLFSLYLHKWFFGPLSKYSCDEVRKYIIGTGKNRNPEDFVSSNFPRFRIDLVSEGGVRMLKLWQALHKKLELPSELLEREPKVAFYPRQKRVVIDNLSRIVKYESGEVVVSTASGNVVLTGRNLRLNVLLPDSLEVVGELHKLEVSGNG